MAVSARQRAALDEAREEAIILDIWWCDTDLSPENLHCDGMITKAAAKKKAKKINARRAKLVKSLGREPSEAEFEAASERAYD